MSTTKSRVLAPAVVLLALVAAGCDNDKKADSSASDAPSSSPTVETTTLTGDVAKQLGAEDGAEATVIPDPLDAPSASAATEEPPVVAQKKKLVQLLAEDSGQVIDTSNPPAVDWVTVYSADQTLKMDVPSIWRYAAWKNPHGGTSFAAGDDAWSQRVVHGVRTNTVDEGMDQITSELPQCSAKQVRSYEDADFVGKARAFVCPDGTATYIVVLDGKGDNSFYRGYLWTTVSDATGLAATERAFSTLDLT